MRGVGAWSCLCWLPKGGLTPSDEWMGDGREVEGRGRSGRRGNCGSCIKWKKLNKNSIIYLSCSFTSVKFIHRNHLFSVLTK